ncbi:endonuclease V [Balneolaceae bacterium YR4-1]|uniref:Endonuclease V n=1 Tax=Halalkalibaculum roseum TaxID=2709311 RepID=A0A6M1SYM1_9BACT|nr:endonuclease V [Halalkalibaculum roseum]NGP75637.1 endonuclease V [Halalkalibaculum roseum]
MAYLVSVGHRIELVLYRLPEPYIGFELSDGLILPISFSGAGTCALVRIKPPIFMSQFDYLVLVQP